MDIKESIKKLTAKKELNAINFYTLTKYGEPMDENQIFTKMTESIDEMMTSKARRGYYSLVVDLDPKFPQVSNDLVNHYSDKNFICFVLNKDIDSRITSPQLYISWDL